jgi:hypothetical protein
MVFYQKSYITNSALINMKLENYTTSKIFLLAVFLFVSCNGTNVKNGNTSMTESTNQASKSGSDVFDLPDSVLITPEAKSETKVVVKEETKTTKEEPKKVATAAKISPKSSSKSPRPSTKSKEEPRVILSPTIQPSSSIFDENKKNTDGYTPKN